MRCKAVIFDRDGTLFDSLEVILRAFNHSIEPFTDRRPADAEWFAAFGPSEPDVIAVFAGQENKQAAFERFYSYYREHFHEIPLFPGIRPLLERLHGAGIPMAVFTGGGYESTIFCLEQQKILSFFQELVTGDRVQHPKPHPEGVLRAIRNLGVAPADTLVVGDAGADILAGQGAGAVTALARWARLAPPFDLPSRPDYVFRQVAELRHMLFPGGSGD